jgi:hypothetical protein
VTAALLSKSDSKRTSRKAKRIRHFYHVKDGRLFQRDASTEHLDVEITLTPEVLTAIAYQLTGRGRLLSVIRNFDERLTRAYGNPADRTVHPELSFVWRSARLELELAEKDGA